MTSGGPLAHVGSCEPDGGRAANAADCDLDWQNDYGQTQHAVLLSPLFTTAPRRLSPGSRAFGVLAFSHFLCSTVCPHLSDFMLKMRTRRRRSEASRSPGRPGLSYSNDVIHGRSPRSRRSPAADRRDPRVPVRAARRRTGPSPISPSPPGVSGGFRSFTTNAARITTNAARRVARVSADHGVITARGQVGLQPALRPTENISVTQTHMRLRPAGMRSPKME